ncbi:MAG: DUF4169 family protein [Pseudomonadota bacterium]
MSVVNFNKARKARARAEKQARAQSNAVKFGRTRAQKAAEKQEAERASQRLDAHQRDEEPEK